MEFLYIDRQGAIDWQRAFEINSVDSLCIVNSSLSEFIKPSTEDIFESADILHSGLLFFNPIAFQRCTLASLNWNFLNPLTDRRVVSWKATGHILYIRKGILSQLSVDVDYESVHVQISDLAYQALARGARVFYEPGLLLSGYKSDPIVVSKIDEIRFIRNNLGTKSLAVVSPMSFVSGVFTRLVKEREVKPLDPVTIKEDRVLKRIEKYSAIIPTINRYDYLKRAIKSLLSNVRPPDEIIVVDQTPKEGRIACYYDEFSKEQVKVIFIDEAGQCTARNLAVQNARNEWLLLFDDDSEAWPEMVTEHVSLLEHSVADISTGISLAPWKDRSYISPAIDFYHFSSVLDTGNCFIRKIEIERVGMFDLAFDRGSGADDNLGKRLYLKGSVIAFNPKAIRTHYKASIGGLRQYGAWWKNKGTLFGPMPLPTESYNFITFYPRQYYLRLCIYKLITSYRRSSLGWSIVSTVLFPWKVLQSYRGAISLSRAK